MQAKISPKEKEERLLVLAVDVDNDLYRKTGITGPVVGRVQNLNAATQLSLADPEETDANTMFQAVKLYDELKKEGYTVNVATITGSEKEGYIADREVARQLELVLDQYKADACIFVTDGASDNRVLPIIESRVKINSVKIVTMKQAEKFENTYFAILEKLKEPHYARIIFGIPALLLLLFAISYAIGTGWELPVALIGIYLILKGFGLEDALLDSFKGFGFSIDRMSFIFYLSSIIFFVASLFIAAGNYYAEESITNSPLLVWAYTIEGFLLLLPISFVLYLIGRIIDVKGRKYLFRGLNYGMYIGSTIIFWVLIYSFVAWLIGQIYFGQFLLYTIIAIFLGIGISILTGHLRKKALSKRKVKGKLVVNELGAMIGKAAGIDVKKGVIVVTTSFGTQISYKVDRIVEISDKVIIR
jgi:putative membrane protein